MVEAIIASSPGRDVLDVGIGTGVAARAFRAAGCRVLGVDPDPRMADFARQSGLEVEVAKFETWDPKGRRFATVIAGQTWHWVDPVAGTAKAGEVLQPEGRLAVFWNVFQPEPDLREAFTAVYRRVLPDLPFFGGTPRGLEAYSGQAAKATDGIHTEGGFGEPEQWRFDWERPYPRDEWLDQVPTFGGHNQLPPAKLEELLTGIGAALDAVGGRLMMGYAAVVVTAVRKAGV